MISYDLHCRIHQMRDRDGLSFAQIARALQIHVQTVVRWAQRPAYVQRKALPRPGKLEAFKATITRLLDRHDDSASQILSLLRQEGYSGGSSILRAHVAKIRPRTRQAFLRLQFAPGQAAQVDWGSAGFIQIGDTRCRLSFFVMVLCFSRRMYVEFTLRESQEHFLTAHHNVFLFFGGVPLAGRPLASLKAINAEVRSWMGQIANTRIHGDTGRRPDELFAEETLRPVNTNPLDLASLHILRSDRTCRIRFDSNTYSVPAQHARQRLHVKAFADRLLILEGERLVAEHRRCYERRRDFELPGHMEPLMAQRLRARQQDLLIRFLRLGPAASAYWQGLQQRRPDAPMQVRRIVALSELHGEELISRLLEDLLALQSFGADYVAILVTQRQGPRLEPAALHLTRASDLLELEIAPPDLSHYDV